MRYFKILSLFVLLILFTFFTTAGIKVKLNTIKAYESESVKVSDSSTSDLSSQTDRLKTSEKAVNVLLVGMDQSDLLTDVIVIARADFVNETVSVLHVPRDTFISSDYPTGKINAVYGSVKRGTGIAALEDVLEQSLKIDIDYYFLISLSDFRDIIDQLGGVKVTLENPIYFLPGKVIEAGEQLLNGEQSEWLVRYRKGYPMGDMDRIDVQKYFLGQAIETVKGKSLMEIVTLATKNYNKIKTDMPISRMLEFAGSLYKVSLDKIQFFTLDGAPKFFGNYAVFEPYTGKLAEILNANFRAKGEVFSGSELGFERVPNLPVEVQAAEIEQEIPTEPEMSEPDQAINFRSVLDRIYEIYNQKGEKSNDK